MYDSKVSFLTLAMNLNITSLFLLLSSVYCHAINAVCVKSSDSVAEVTVPWGVECTENCSSIDECDFSHWPSTMIVLDPGHHNVTLSSIL